MGLNNHSQATVETNMNAYVTDATMGINNKNHKPGKTNVNDVHNYQHSTAPSHVDISPEYQDDHT